MSGPTLWERFRSWAAYLPIRLAYRIIWLTAKAGSPDARAVYHAMWGVNLDLPPLAKIGGGA